MKKIEKEPKKIIKNVILIIIACGVLGNIMAMFFSTDYLSHPREVIEQTVISMIWGSALWIGNLVVYHWVSLKYSWIEQPLKVLIVGVSASLIYSVTAIIVVSFFTVKVYYGLTFEQYVQSTYSSFKGSLILVLIISLAGHAFGFFKNWRASIINEEQLKRERLSLQYEALKNQVNPHFLFNSLNILTSLVYKDADLAANFIKQLSEVYRYVLDQKEKELVDLSEELKFAESYIYLQKMRFEDNLIIEKHIPSDIKGMVIPLSVQILIENAIKHNIVSKAEPLTIRISADKEYISIINNLQMKTIVNESTNIGLKNFKTRYEYLTQKPFIVENNGKEFIVRVPLLKVS